MGRKEREEDRGRKIKWGEKRREKDSEKEREHQENER